MKIDIRKISSDEGMKECLSIRFKVFVEGQSVPLDRESDGLDENCAHYLLSANNIAIGTTRVRNIDNRTLQIERVAILDKYQGKGLGSILIKHIIEDIKTNSKVNTIKVSSQSSSVNFYESLGFVPYTDQYMDAGISHIGMALKL